MDLSGEADWLNAIEFPFRNWAVSRFCDDSFGIWYGSDLVETMVHETVHHWRHGFLERELGQAWMMLV